MMRRLASAALRLYPKAWRERYWDEFVVMLQGREVRAADVFDIVRVALRAQGGNMAFRRLLGVGLALAVGIAAGYLGRPYVPTSRHVLASDMVRIESAGDDLVRLTVQGEVIEGRDISFFMSDGGFFVALHDREAALDQMLSGHK